MSAGMISFQQIRTLSKKGDFFDLVGASGQVWGRVMIKMIIVFCMQLSLVTVHVGSSHFRQCSESSVCLRWAQVFSGNGNKACHCLFGEKNS